MIQNPWDAHGVELLATSEQAGSGEGMPCDWYRRSYVGPVVLLRADITFEAGICFCRDQMLPSKVLASALLGPEERNYFDRLDFEKRRQSYLLGRYSAKRAVSFLTGEDLEGIQIEYGIFNNPLVSQVGRNGRLEISISHSSCMGAALAFPAVHPMGIDLEPVNRAKTAVIEGGLSENELKMLRRLTSPGGDALLLTIAWTIKESLSKVLRTGLTAPLSVYEISRIEKSGSIYVSHFANFSQYMAISFILDDHVCTISCPKKTVCRLDLAQMLMELSREFPE